MTLHRRFATLTLVLSAGLFTHAVRAADLFHKISELNYYEWTAVAPVVVAGTSLGENGRWLEFQVRHSLRGPVDAGGVIRIDLKQANRERRRSDYPFSLKMPAETEYLVVLQNPVGTKDGGRMYPMARGVRSVRELPIESQDGVIEAVNLFLQIQDFHDDRMTWRKMGEMLDENNPLVLLTALQQFAKFRRGTPEHLFSLRPLFDHPDPSIREGAATVAGLIVERHGDRSMPEEEALMAELIGVARRDEIVEPRVAATEALASFGVARVVTVLEEIARSDPEQLVRYAAERLLFEYRKEQEAEARRPRLDGAAN